MTIDGVVAVVFLFVLVALSIRNTWGKKWDGDDGPADYGASGDGD